jgi:predicted O-methyltransferase YrrM
MTKDEIDLYLESKRIEARKEYIPVMRDKTALLLASLVEKYQPKNILEIGTSIGTSGILTLSRCDGFLATIDIDDSVQRIAKENFRECGFIDRCEFINGDCNEVVYMMADNKYDFIILDGPKGQYLELYEMLIPKLNSGGILFADDVLFYGLIDGEGIARHKHRTIITNLRKFKKRVETDDRIIATFYDIEDGVTVAEKK